MQPLITFHILFQKGMKFHEQMTQIIALIRITLLNIRQYAVKVFLLQCMDKVLYHLPGFRSLLTIQNIVFCFFIKLMLHQFFFYKILNDLYTQHRLVCRCCFCYVLNNFLKYRLFDERPGTAECFSDCLCNLLSFKFLKLSISFLYLHIHTTYLVLV